jgi:purine-binding chemotaxis protein CheW
MSRLITQLCTFTVADLCLAVEVTRVQEVLRAQPMTRIPLAAARIHGLINLRGQIVTAVDLRASLGLPMRTSDEPLMNVVIRSGERSISLLVDSIGDVLEVSQDAFELPPSTMKLAQRALLESVCKLPDRLLLVLATARVFDMSDAGARPPALGMVS